MLLQILLRKKGISGSGFPCRPLQTVIHYVFGLFFMYLHTHFFPTRVSVAQGTQGLDASINAQYDIRSYVCRRRLLKVSSFQNVILVSSNLPKSQRFFSRISSALASKKRPFQKSSVRESK